MVDSIDSQLPDSHEIGHSGKLKNEKIVHQETIDEALKIDRTRQQLRTQLDSYRLEKAERPEVVRALTNIHVAAHFLTPPKGAVIENPDEYIADIWNVAPSIDMLVHTFPQRTQQQDDAGHHAEVITLSEGSLLGRKTTRIISYTHQHGRIIRIEELIGNGKLVRVVTMPAHSKDAEKLINDGQIFSNSIEHKRNILQTDKEERVDSNTSKPSQTQVYAMEAANALRLISQSLRKTHLGKTVQQQTVSEITTLAA